MADIAPQVIKALVETGSFAAMIGRGRIGHWVVVDGLEGGTILLRDPARGVLRLPCDEFMDMWNGNVVFQR